MSASLRARLRRALTSNRAATEPGGGEAGLPGRTYAIPFDDVWRAALALAGGGIRGWRLREADDTEGIIRAEGGSLLGPIEITLRIGLDANGQTRADGTAVLPGRRADLGSSARALRRFFRALDRRVEGPGSSRSRRVA